MQSELVIVGVSALSGIIGAGGVVGILKVISGWKKTRADTDHVTARIEIDLVGEARALYASIIGELRTLIAAQSDRITAQEERIAAQETHIAELVERLADYERHNNELQIQIARLQSGTNNKAATDEPATDG